mgnify:CR=1 FL=1
MEQNQDEFDQKRFLLAMIISGLILVMWNVFFAPETPPPAVDGDQVASTTGEAPATTGATAKDVPVKLADAPPPAVDLPVLTHELRTEHFRIVTSTAGAQMVEAEIYEPEQYNVEGDLLADFPEDSPHFPYGLSFTQNSIALPRGLVWAFVPDVSKKEGGAYKTVTYRHVDPAGRYQIDKTYSVDPENLYQLGLDVVVTNRGTNPLTDSMALDLTLFKSADDESSFLDMRPEEGEGICKTSDDIERELLSGIESPLTFDEFPVRWGAVDKRYFLFAALTGTDAQKCTIEKIEESILRTRLVQPKFSIGPGESYRMGYELFVGPKDFDVLESMGSNMEAAVDYGFWTFLARPFRWALVAFHGWVGNWGLAIILLTIVIRLLMWPINHKVYVNSERMKDIQPKLKVLQEKYAEDKQRLTEETMKLWKENKVSPLGCLPMVLQFPILLALYYMILNSVELYQADFALWYTDLSAPDPYFVLPLLMGAVMFGQQSMMTVETPNPQMATMMKFMPIMFAGFMLFLPSGVVLYYFVSLIIGLIQQIWIKRSFAAKRAQTA